jgi:hypothetical protein
MNDLHEFGSPASVRPPLEGLSCCDECGALAATKRVEFWRIIGAVFVFHVTASGGCFCKSCIHQYFWAHTLVTLCLGWCGFISSLLTPFVLLHNVLRYILCLGMPPVPEQIITTTPRPVAEKKLPWATRIRRLYRSLRKWRSKDEGMPCIHCKRRAFPIEGTTWYRCWSCGSRFEDPEL